MVSIEHISWNNRFIASNVWTELMMIIDRQEAAIRHRWTILFWALLKKIDMETNKRQLSIWKPTFRCCCRDTTKYTRKSAQKLVRHFNQDVNCNALDLSVLSGSQAAIQVFSSKELPLIKKCCQIATFSTSHFERFFYNQKKKNFFQHYSNTECKFFILLTM